MSIEEQERKAIQKGVAAVSQALVSSIPENWHLNILTFCLANEIALFYEKKKGENIEEAFKQAKQQISNAFQIIHRELNEAHYKEELL